LDVKAPSGEGGDV